MHGIFTYIWLIFVVNVSKYTIHGFIIFGAPHIKKNTLPETNIAPARKPSPKGNNRLPTIDFQVLASCLSSGSRVTTIHLRVVSSQMVHK